MAFSEYMNFKVSMARQALFDFEEKEKKSYVENFLLAFKVTKPSKQRKYSERKVSANWTNPARKDYLWAYGLTLSLVSLLIQHINVRIQFGLGLIQLFLGKTRNLSYIQYKNETLKKMVRF